MKKKQVYSEEHILKELSTGKKEAFKFIYTNYYDQLCMYAYKLVNDMGVAEEMVQDVIMHLWENRSSVEKINNLNSYLYRTVHNKSLNYIKHTKVQLRYQTEAAYKIKQLETQFRTEDIEQELLNQIETYITELPDPTKAIMRLKYIEGKKYKEISKELKIAERTVGLHISKALEELKAKTFGFIKKNF